MNGKSVGTFVQPSVRAVQDEWGMFDPNQAGLEAAFRAVRALAEPAAMGDTTPDATVDDFDDATHVKVADPAALAPFRPVLEPTAFFVKAAARPTWPNRDQHAEPRASGPTRIVPHLGPSDEAVSDLTDLVPRPQPAPKPAERGAVYTLEFATRCPQCSAEITTVRVSRLLRTQVSFTSTLPRKGYIIVCPECDGILSAELSGLI